MNITELLIPSKPTTPEADKTPIHDNELMTVWEQILDQCGFQLRPTSERNTLTDAILTPTSPSSPFVVDTPVHIKVIGRHMNGSFRCHIGTGKASRPIRSTELCRQMRLLTVFFRAENSKCQLVSPEFIFFPTWLLHLFRYTQHGSTPGRTDVRFLENATMAKEDHIYRLNHVLNTLFRFNLHHFDSAKLNHAIALANFLFDTAGLDHRNLPRPISEGDTDEQPALYRNLLKLLHAPRPTKVKPVCSNCNAKPASRRKLCVACYRYQLKHDTARPLRLIVANRPGPRVCGATTTSSPVSARPKSCANCGVHETHQWYRNLCGTGHWCETCKSYYLRHTKVRPPELFVKAAKRKVDVRALVDWSEWSLDADEDDSDTLDPTSLSDSASLSPSSRRTSTSTMLTPATASSSWVPSGCRPHLYHPRNSSFSNASSGSSSPISTASSPTTPPPPATPYLTPHLHAHQYQHDQHHPTSTQPRHFYQPLAQHPQSASLLSPPKQMPSFVSPFPTWSFD